MVPVDATAIWNDSVCLRNYARTIRALQPPGEYPAQVRSEFGGLKLRRGHRPWQLVMSWHFNEWTGVCLNSKTHTTTTQTRLQRQVSICTHTHNTWNNIKKHLQKKCSLIILQPKTVLLLNWKTVRGAYTGSCIYKICNSYILYFSLIQDIRPKEHDTQNATAMRCLCEHGVVGAQGNTCERLRGARIFYQEGVVSTMQKITGRNGSRNI